MELNNKKHYIKIPKETYDLIKELFTNSSKEWQLKWDKEIYENKVKVDRVTDIRYNYGMTQTAKNIFKVLEESGEYETK